MISKVCHGDPVYDPQVFILYDLLRYLPLEVLAPLGTAP
jgi:hypothetical protein